MLSVAIQPNMLCRYVCIGMPSAITLSVIMPNVVALSAMLLECPMLLLKKARVFEMKSLRERF
jgi:hypothetical protein